jgi:uncharacterized membrane protein YeaQ/YmgE (transglycosylase-associated protein family)
MSLSFYAYVLVGLLVGLFGRAVLPATRTVGFWGTLLLGMVGGFIGGILSAIVAPAEVLATRPSPIGLVSAAVGAAVVMVALVVVSKRRRFA